MENDVRLTKESIKELGWERQEGDEYYCKIVELNSKHLQMKITYRFKPEGIMTIERKAEGDSTWQTSYFGLALGLEDFKTLQSWIGAYDMISEPELKP